MAVNPALQARHRRSPAPSARPRSRPGSASNICSRPRRSNPTSIPSAQASTSSAKGLYQFIEQTWLATMKQDGAGARLWPLCRRHRAVCGRALRGGRSRHACGDHAAAQRSGRQRDDGGRASRATMPSSLVSATSAAQPTEGELYIAHFLGSDGAGKLINGAASAAARARRRHVSAGRGGQPSIFYDRPAARAASAKSTAS